MGESTLNSPTAHSATHSLLLAAEGHTRIAQAATGLALATGKKLTTIKRKGQGPVREEASRLELVPTWALILASRPCTSSPSSCGPSPLTPAHHLVHCSAVHWLRSSLAAGLKVFLFEPVGPLEVRRVHPAEVARGQAAVDGVHNAGRAEGRGQFAAGQLLHEVRAPLAGEVLAHAVVGEFIFRWPFCLRLL